MACQKDKPTTGGGGSGGGGNGGNGGVYIHGPMTLMDNKTSQKLISPVGFTITITEYAPLTNTVLYGPATITENNISAKFAINSNTTQVKMTFYRKDCLVANGTYYIFNVKSNDDIQLGFLLQVYCN